MAQPDTPFTSAISAGHSIAVLPHQRLILRCESASSVLVVIGVGRTPTASVADYFLTGGDAVEINPQENTVVGIVAITGTPKIYWRLEKAEYGS
jgi:hypothetical protein